MSNTGSLTISDVSRTSHGNSTFALNASSAYASQLKSRSTAEFDFTTRHVTGMNGDKIIRTSTADKWKTLHITYDCYLAIPEQTYVVTYYLQQYGKYISYWKQKHHIKIYDDSDTTHYRIGRMVGEFEPKLIEGMHAATFTLEFECEPERYCIADPTESLTETVTLAASDTASHVIKLRPLHFGAFCPYITISNGFSSGQSLTFRVYTNPWVESGKSDYWTFTLTYPTTLTERGGSSTVEKTVLDCKNQVLLPITNYNRITNYNHVGPSPYYFPVIPGLHNLQTPSSDKYCMLIMQKTETTKDITVTVDKRYYDL